MTPPSTASARMPGTVKAAQYVLTFQMAFGLVGFAAGIGGFFATFHWMLLIPLGYAAVSLSTVGWLLSRWSTRRRAVRRLIVGVETAYIAGGLALRAMDPGLTWRDMIVVVAGFPLVAIVLMLLPPAGRWFHVTSQSRPFTGA
ncbi:hypothetical protein GCM10022224_028380 [Nonomuraea antimicrobica]|uniref:Uncharacterized protein n=1 Tax=Nonomuraea antimicrobica TaxID=561173 RepID=A0ABP7BLJ8_9ACTN